MLLKCIGETRKIRIAKVNPNGGNTSQDSDSIRSPLLFTTIHKYTPSKRKSQNLAPFFYQLTRSHFHMEERMHSHVQNNDCRGVPLCLCNNTFLVIYSFISQLSSVPWKQHPVGNPIEKQFCWSVWNARRIFLLKKEEHPGYNFHEHVRTLFCPASSTM